MSSPEVCLDLSQRKKLWSADSSNIVLLGCRAPGVFSKTIPAAP